jgi:CubicO group peptidase (beta-lactamase class C family)
MISEGAVGRASVRPWDTPASLETIYDLASLTKPLVTSFLYLALRNQLGLSEDDPAWRFLPEIDRMDKREITLRHLLTHTSGMPAWVPFYLKGSTVGEYLAQLRERPPESRPGTRVEYSCAGYVMLGEILHRAASVPLDRLASEVIFGPLALKNTSFNPPLSWQGRVAATEDSCEYERKLAGPAAAGYGGFREGVIRGQVHDQNAWVLGGVAGNAGLFSTARDTVAIATEYLGARAEASNGLLDETSIEQATNDCTAGLNEARSLAFRIASRGETAAGADLPVETIGHNGFTGTSVWMDTVRPRIYVLLTNRVHPRVSDTVDMLSLRRGFHAAACRI